MLAFIACILLCVTPLQRMVHTSLLAQFPLSRLLAGLGAWLPSDLHLAKQQQTSLISTNSSEFLLLIALLFAIYGLAALFVQRQAETAKNTGVLACIWVGAALAGLVFVATPAMLSHDLFVYADYGHTLVTHGTNLYFTPPAAVSHDALTQLDDWKLVTAAYGPFWLYICSLLALLLGNAPWHYILAFRLLGLVAHLLNALLVAKILRVAGCSRRTISLGTLLYAWNPLVLVESSLGAHNDIAMVTFILLGAFLCLRAEQKGLTQPGSYIPAVIALTLSALIKFTTAPLVFFFIVLLARKTLYSTSPDSEPSGQTPMLHWWRALLHICCAGLACVLTVLAFYLPFWAGHTLHEIVHSFSTPPSAIHSENSFHRALYEWIKLHGLPAHSSWLYLPLYFFGQHSVWNNLSALALGCSLIIGAIYLWHRPTTAVLILASLASLELLLVVTPWLFAWYVLWLVGLAAASLALPDNRFRRACVGFALTFSLSVFLTYYAYGDIHSSDYAQLEVVTMFGLPLLVFWILLAVRRRAAYL